jgi:hypothetical protein
MNRQALLFHSVTDFGRPGEIYHHGDHTSLAAALRDINRWLAPGMTGLDHWSFWVIDASGTRLAGPFDREHRPPLSARR